MSYEPENDMIVSRRQQQPIRKIAKAGSVITGDEIQKEIGSLVTDMKSMLDVDLVKQAKPV